MSFRIFLYLISAIPHSQNAIKFVEFHTFSVRFPHNYTNSPVATKNKNKQKPLIIRYLNIISIAFHVMAHLFLLTKSKKKTTQYHKKIVMKKILILAALVLGFGINATASEKTTTEISVIQEKQYKPIEPSAIPADALKTISSKYGG